MTKGDKAALAVMILFLTASASYFVYAIGYNIKIKQENKALVKKYKEQLVEKYSTDLIINPVATTRMMDLKVKQYQDSLDTKLIAFPQGEISR